MWTTSSNHRVRFRLHTGQGRCYGLFGTDTAVGDTTRQALQTCLHHAAQVFVRFGLPGGHGPANTLQDTFALLANAVLDAAPVGVLFCAEHTASYGFYCAPRRSSTSLPRHRLQFA